MKKILTAAMLLLSLYVNANCIQDKIIVTDSLKDSILNVGDFLDLINKDFNNFKDIDGIETDGHVVFSPSRLSRPTALAIKVNTIGSPANKILSSYVALKLMSNDVISYVYSSKLTTHCIFFSEKGRTLSNSNLEKLLSEYDVEVTKNYNQCKSFQ
jgi:hypothetical protein